MRRIEKERSEEWREKCGGVERLRRREEERSEEWREKCREDREVEKKREGEKRRVEGEV